MVTDGNETETTKIRKITPFKDIGHVTYQPNELIEDGEFNTCFQFSYPLLLSEMGSSTVQTNVPYQKKKNYWVPPIDNEICKSLGPSLQPYSVDPFRYPNMFDTPDNQGCMWIVYRPFQFFLSPEQRIDAHEIHSYTIRFGPIAEDPNIYRWESKFRILTTRNRRLLVGDLRFGLDFYRPEKIGDGKFTLSNNSISREFENVRYLTPKQLGNTTKPHYKPMIDTDAHNGFLVAYSETDDHELIQRLAKEGYLLSETF